MRNTLIILMYSLGAGLLMAAFILGTGITRHLFSLCAVVLGIQFFKRHDGKGMRITFVVLVLVLALFFSSLYVLLAVANGWYLNPEYLKGVQREG